MKERISILSLFTRGELEADSVCPQYLQLAQKLRGMLAGGQLFVGQMMPSSRELAEHLGVSQKVIRRAYEELLSQGIFETARGVGTFIAEQATAHDKCASTGGEVPQPVLSKYARLLLDCSPEPSTIDLLHLLNFDAAPTELLPIKEWRQCTLELWREFKETELEYEFAPEHSSGLQRALSDYLLRAKGLDCQTNQIAVFGGIMAPLWLLSKLLLKEGDHVAVENPGYPEARTLFSKLGCHINGIPIDEEGLIVDSLDQLTPAPKVLYVTPSHDPTGVTLSLRRREHLAWVAREKGIVIIEDDYDNEFDIKRSRLPTLFSLVSEQVIHFSYFWKTLYPLITCGFMVLPTKLTAAYNRALREPDNDCSTRLPFMEEAALARFLSRGILERHIHKIAPVYAVKQRALVSAISRELKELAVLPKASAGMHICLRLNVTLGESLIMEIASATNFPLVSTAPFYIEGYPGHEYLVPFGHLEERSVHSVLSEFAGKLRAQQDLCHRLS